MRRRLLDHTCKRTVTGNPAVAKSVARMYPDISFPGKTEQQQTNGYQLFDASKLPTKTQGGATVTNNGDGSFTISGSGTIVSEFRNQYNYTHDETIKLIHTGKIKLLNGSTSPYVLVQIISGESTIVISVTQNIEKNITDEMLSGNNYLRILFYGIMGTEIVEETVRPMLYQEGDGTWEPYTGGKPSPSPEYPQDIVNTQSPVQVEVMGANLFDISNGTTKNVIGDNVIIDSRNATIKLRRTNTGNYEEAIFPIKLKAGNEVTLKYEYKVIEDENLSKIVRVKIEYGNGGSTVKTISNDNKVTFNIDENAVKIILAMQEINSATLLLSGISVSYGINPIPYEPYKNQTVTITSERPITKWDKLIKQDDVWGWLYQTAYIESYNDEEITGEWQSTTGELSTGASVQYKTSPEFVPLSDEEQQLMNSLHTNNPTTVVQNSIGTDVTLTYKTKRSLEVMQ